jgi:regulatory protein
MKITDIKQQVKRQDRYSVYVDGKYSFSLSEHELMLQGLRIDQEFDNQEFDQIKKTAIEDKAYMRALDLLARRQRSEWEMQQYLKRKDYDESTIKIILNKLSDRELLNDKKFAEAWVDNRRLLKNVSKRRLKQELQQKHISNQIISEVLKDDETDERVVLNELVAKKRSQSRYQDEQKLMSYLLRQGFNYGDIKDVLNSVDQT